MSTDPIIVLDTGGDPLAVARKIHDELWHLDDVDRDKLREGLAEARGDYSNGITTMYGTDKMTEAAEAAGYVCREIPDNEAFLVWAPGTFDPTWDEEDA